MAAVMCRACLRSDAALCSITCNETAKQAFLDLTGIEISQEDGLSQTICNECLRLLNEFTEFREKVIKNNQYLLQSLVEKSDSKYKQLEQEQILEKRDLKIETESTVKEEIEIMYLDTINVDNHSFVDDGDIWKEGNEEKVKVRKKSKKRKKEKSKSKKTPRVLIHVDPEKITTIILTKEEQLRRQAAEADREHYLSMPYKCEKCYKGFNYQRKLDSHIENYHKLNSKFQCDVCTRTMSNSASLGLHMKKHELVYECNICKTSFVEKPRAILHYKSAHEGIETEFPCKQCGRVFRNRSTLYGHMRNHHPLNERPKCSVCNKTFVSKDSLDDHMLIHTGERGYACTVCGRRFRLRQCARAHQRSHSSYRPVGGRDDNDDVTAKYACVLCGVQVASRCALRAHVCARVRGSKGVVAVCHYCGRGFAARRTLENHILVHTGSKPHTCQHCGTKFTQQATLRTHVKRRHPAATSGKIEN